MNKMNEENKMCHICLTVTTTKSNEELDLCDECFDRVAEVHREYLKEKELERNNQKTETFNSGLTEMEESK